MRPSRYRSLDIWRGVACLVVVAYHLVHARQGPTDSRATLAAFDVVSYLWLGVPLFFVISGYCVVGACDSMRAKPNVIGRYFWRRFRRIFPPYWIALAISLVLVALFSLLGWEEVFQNGRFTLPDPGDLSTTQWLGNATLTEAWRVHLSDGVGRWYLGQAWSLGYEEQFYALCGLALLLIPKRLFTGIVLITVATALLRVASSVLGFPRSGFFFDGYWLLFALGSLVYYIVNYAKPPYKALLNGLLIVTCVGSIALLTRQRNDFSLSLVVASFCALALSMLHRYDEPIASSRYTRPIAFCGEISYSLYLIHVPIGIAVSQALAECGVPNGWRTLLVTLPCGFLASILAAYVFHIHVERRFLNTSVRT